jgi:hypothetical protein
MSTAHGVVAGACLGAALAIATAIPTQAATAGDPPCGYDVHRQNLTVTSLTAKGRARVWLDNGDGTSRVVREARIRPGQTVTFTLKRKHTSDDFTVSVIRGRLVTDDGGQLDRKRVSRCDMA